VEWIDESELVAELNEKGQKTCIGSGSFGTVFLARRDGDRVCVKMFKTGATDSAKAEHEKELKVHMNLQHRRIVQLYGACEIESSLGIVLEYVSGGSLHRKLQQQYGSPINWPLHLRLAKEIAAGVKYLHSKKIVHRDLKSHDVLIDERDGAKLCDFGLAKTKKTSKSIMSTGEKGTVLWMPSEIFGKTAK
jgi:serine/threonine protein kinase